MLITAKVSWLQTVIKVPFPLLISFPALNLRGDAYEKHLLEVFLYCTHGMYCHNGIQCNFFYRRYWLDRIGGYKMLPQRVEAISEFQEPAVTLIILWPYGNSLQSRDIVLPSSTSLSWHLYCCALGMKKNHLLSCKKEM